MDIHESQNDRENLDPGFDRRCDLLGPGMPYIGLNIPDPMHSNPRFQELLRKMNLPVDEKE